METVIPSAKTLFNRPKEDAKRILVAAGFRPVRKGELPEHGDKVINCNRFYSRNHSSASTFEVGTIDKPTMSSHPYTVAYDRITYYHSYSKSWFERVMWIRKKEGTKKPVESMKELSNRLKLHNDPKRLLMAWGFRPVGHGEVPAHGDEVFNCNTLYDRSKRSPTTFEHAVVYKPTNNSANYALTYTTTDYEHTYSKSWFEKVMWIRKKEVTNKSTEQKMETDDVRDNYMIDGVIYENTTKAAMEQVLQLLSNKHPGERVVCYKLVPVAVAYKPIEPKQVQWL